MTARVLVVDDVRSNRKLLRTRLSLEYFEVLAAANGPDAIAICEKGGCDIVLLDVEMQGMTVFEDAGALRAAAEAARIAERAPDNREPRIPGRPRGRLRFDYGLDWSRRMAGELKLRRALSSSGPSALPIESWRAAIASPRTRRDGI